MRAAGARRVGHAPVPAAPLPVAAVPGSGVSAETPLALSLPGDPAPDRPLVLAAGRLAPQKGFATLLEAAPGGGTCGPSRSWSSRGRDRSRPS